MEATMAPPFRTCMGCGQKKPKAALVRMVLGEGGEAVLDGPQTAEGRGAYLCGKGCLSAAIKRKAFGKAFRGKCKASQLQTLEAVFS